MARPFNFFQFVTGISVTGAISLVNPSFEDFLTGSGLYTPQAMLENPINYIWLLLEDTEQRFPASYRLAPSGNLRTSHPNAVSMLPSFSGTLFPVSADDASFFPSINGAISGINIDIPVMTTLFSGLHTGCIIDQSVLRVSFYGLILDKTDDRFLVCPLITGFFTGTIIDIKTFGVGLSGSIIRREYDPIANSILLDTITWSFGHPSNRIFLSGQYLLDMSLDQIFFRSS